MAGVSISNNPFSKLKQRLLDKTKTIDSALARDVLTIYSNAQRKRWMTEGSSEGQNWESLDPTYAKQKLKRFASYPGGGRKMLIATGRLVDDTTVNYYHLIGNSSLKIVIPTPYASYVNDKRNFNKFSQETRSAIVKKISQYVLGGS